MGSKSFLTSRLIEVWAHGQDIWDAVGASRAASARIRHVAQMGAVTWGWSHLVRGDQPPDGDVRVELSAPSGADWAKGADNAPASASGPAEDFCLVVAQRRHVAGTDRTLVSEPAADWMNKTQSFAGGVTLGPAPKGHR